MRSKRGCVGKNKGGATKREQQQQQQGGAINKKASASTIQGATAASLDSRGVNINGQQEDKDIKGKKKGSLPRKNNEQRHSSSIGLEAQISKDNEEAKTTKGRHSSRESVDRQK